MLKRLTLGLSLLAGSAFGVDCNSDCADVAGFNYPCPNARNPFKVCRGVEPGAFEVCRLAKNLSCEQWKQAVGACEPYLRPELEKSFNRYTWRAAELNGRQQEYMTKCEAAGVAGAAALGASVSGPWGAAVGGGVGTFVAYQLCEQSRAW